MRSVQQWGDIWTGCKDTMRQGKYPHFCLFRGFCQYFETDGELEDHYQVHPNHRLTKQDHDGFRRNAELVRYFRTWDFPRFQEMPLNQCKVYCQLSYIFENTH